MAEDRRTLLKVLSGVFGGGAAVAVAGPAVRALVDPAGKVTVSGAGEFVPVAALDAVPDDGSPVNVPVIVEAPKDGWNKLPATQVGTIFLARKEQSIMALSTICPHLGCGIDYSASSKQFVCPCHDSSFTEDGAVAAGPSPRGMDSLETRVKDGKIEVRFEKFKIGTTEKVPA